MKTLIERDTTIPSHNVRCRTRAPTCSTMSPSDWSISATKTASDRWRRIGEKSTVIYCKLVARWFRDHYYRYQQFIITAYQLLSVLSVRLWSDIASGFYLAYFGKLYDLHQTGDLSLCVIKRPGLMYLLHTAYRPVVY